MITYASFFIKSTQVQLSTKCGGFPFFPLIFQLEGRGMSREGGGVIRFYYTLIKFYQIVNFCLIQNKQFKNPKRIISFI